MTVQEMKKLLAEFAKTLDDKSKDEWYTTDRDVWEQMAKRFLMWCNSNRKKLQPEVK